MNEFKVWLHPHFNNHKLRSQNINLQLSHVKNMEPSRKQVLRMMEIKAQLKTLETIEPIQRPA